MSAAVNTLITPITQPEANELIIKHIQHVVQGFSGLAEGGALELGK